MLRVVSASEEENGALVSGGWGGVLSPLPRKKWMVVRDAAICSVRIEVLRAEIFHKEQC